MIETCLLTSRHNDVGIILTSVGGVAVTGSGWGHWAEEQSFCVCVNGGDSVVIDQSSDGGEHGVGVDVEMAGTLVLHQPVV